VTFSIPVLGLTPLLRVSVAPASGLRAAAFVLSVMLSITVGVAVDFLFGLLVVRFSENAYALRLARDGMTPLLSGAVIPLPLLPWGLGGVLAWLPLASMVAAPLRIYTGDGDVIALLSRQAGWAVFLWVVTRPAWRRTAVRMVSFGG
jgi:ABC-2 type transport system permease protein